MLIVIVLYKYFSWTDFLPTFAVLCVLFLYISPQSVGRLRRNYVLSNVKYLLLTSANGVETLSNLNPPFPPNDHLLGEEEKAY